MSAILTEEFSSECAQAFLSSLDTSDSNIKKNVYLTIGRTSEWTDETTPPTPTDIFQKNTTDTVTQTDKVTLRSNIVGIKKIYYTNMMLTIPRNDWAVGKVYNIVPNYYVNGTMLASPHNYAPSGRRMTDYYCLNSENDVFICVATPGNYTAGANINTPIATGYNEKGTLVSGGSCEPIFSNSSADIVTADGYTWKYAYSVTSNMAENGFLLANWMPVPYKKGGITTGNQGLYGIKNAHEVFGAYRVAISINLEDEGTAIPYTTVFRQVGILVDPMNSSGALLTNEVYGAADFNINSGNLVYIENRKPIPRDESQSETLKLILVF